MVLFILGIIIFIVALCIIFYGFSENNRSYIAGGLGVVILSLVLAIIGCIKFVPTGSTGIVTTFGRIENINLNSERENKKKIQINPWILIKKNRDCVQNTRK